MINEESVKYLDPLLRDPKSLAREASRRKRPYDQKKIKIEELSTHEGEGWKTDSQLKYFTRIRREKNFDERLENRFWMLLFILKYLEMNEGRKFTVLIERKGAEALRKQIDVFAKDEETVIVAECKASDKVTKRSLQKDIEEFANLKGPISHAISNHYGASFKPKIIWLFVTENIVWSKPDRERASGENIRIITERELRYYSQIAEHIGKAARYQFLAEFLKDQQIPELGGKKVPAIRGKLGGKIFYCFVTTPRHLLKISFINHRSLNDPEGEPSYQRLIARSRIRAIGKYIRDGGFFPNNILINFKRKIRFEKISSDDLSMITFGNLYLPDRYRSAWIIDGQHRLYGFSHIEDSFLDQNIFVIAFENISRSEEANLFVTINNEQKSVSKHLLDDLEGELKWGSDVPTERIGAIAARLINTLNMDVGEAFHNRITQQGIPTTNKTCLTIPAIKESLRRSGLLGKALLSNSNYELGPLCAETDSMTLERARCALNQYFGMIRNSNLLQWENGRDGDLCTNIAIQAYIMLLGSLIKYWEANTAANSVESTIEDILLAIEDYLEPIIEFLGQADEKQMRTEFKVPFGSGGPREYYFRLCSMIKDRYSDFQPEGMDKWEEEHSEDRIQDADRKLKDIVEEMRTYVFDVFRSKYGEEKMAYWEKGVADKTIKGKAYERSLDNDIDERYSLETYLEVVEIKKIIESKQNWPIFKSVFNIPESGEKGLAKNLKWMDTINELRRIPAHPAKERRYKADDFDYIDFIYEEFIKRLKEAQENPNQETITPDEDNS